MVQTGCCRLLITHTNSGYSIDHAGDTVFDSGTDYVFNTQFCIVSARVKACMVQIIDVGPRRYVGHSATP